MAYNDTRKDVNKTTPDEKQERYGVTVTPTGGSGRDPRNEPLYLLVGNRPNIFARSRPWSYNPRRFEEAMRRYDEVVAAGPSHPLYLDLVRGATYYWKEKGFSSAHGGPDGRGFFDKARAQAYVRDVLGVQNSWTGIPPSQQQQSQERGAKPFAEPQAAAATPQLTPEERLRKWYAEQRAAEQTQPQDNSTTPQPTTANPAGPGTSAAQAPAGQQGATTNTTPQTNQEQQNQLTQFRSSRTGFSGNRRYHPFGGS